MLLLVHALLHAALGATWAMLRPPQRSSRTLPSAWWPLCAALYLDVLMLAPLIAYQARLWPAYFFSYAYDPLLLPKLYQAIALVSLGVLVLLPTSFAASYVGAHLLERSGRLWLPRCQAVGLLLAAAALLVRHREQWLTIADFAGFWRGGGTPIWTHVHAQLQLAAYVCAATLLLWCRLRPGTGGSVVRAADRTG